MSSRYRYLPGLISQLHFRPFSALRASLKSGYGWPQARADLFAGVVVALVAIPLGMALAIAIGVPPEHGLYTVIVAGGLVALLGGSRFQVTGPTAAFVVILAPVVAKFGLQGLLLAGMLSGILLVLMGLAGLGQLIEFIPHPVTTGFTSGIAVIIATLQLKDVLGIQLPGNPEGVFERLQAVAVALPSSNPWECLIAALTLALLLFWPRFNKRIPAPLVALTVAALAAVIVKQVWSGAEIATIAERFGGVHDGVSYRGVPQTLPQLHLPWADINMATLKALLPSAFAIALLGAIESLLSAVITDGMTRTRHDPDAELLALGIGNIVCPFFGGIPATGAIARTATNIRYGAHSPLAAMLHAGFVLLVVICCAPLVSQLPMAALAALLLLVAYNMSEARHFRHILKVAPRSDVLVLLTCFLLTVLFDMVVGVTVGVVLAALLFMRRMAALTQGKELKANEHKLPELDNLPPQILFYEIAGPLFFGAARKAIGALHEISNEVRVVIFDLRRVPVMDVSGLVALETTVEQLLKSKRFAILTGVNHIVRPLINRSTLISNSNNVAVFDTLSEALAMAKQVAVSKANGGYA